MYVDSHVHLQPHGGQQPMTRERIERYVESALAGGVERLAITEHLFRFREAYDGLYGWWEADASQPALSAAAHAYWQDHVTMSVADYVRAIEDAKAAGLPVLLGLEMDWIPGRADDLRRFLAPYDWDVVLGSVHWIGAWMVDGEYGPSLPTWWDCRDIDEFFGEYASYLSDAAASRLCDVLAHPDLPKLFGHHPTSFEPLHAAIIEAAVRGGCALEVNSSGYNKPVAEPCPALPVLERARAAGLSITLASDAHGPERVGERLDEIAAWAARAGYRKYVSFEHRQPVTHALPVTSAK
jgi:histidinol-phosphatase (PHP family)